MRSTVASTLSVVPLLVGLVPVLLAHLLIPDIVPNGGRFAGVAMLAVLIGLVFWLPTLTQRYEFSIEERFVDERAEQHPDSG